ncbi:MAG TPA: hypothetical protein VNN10_10955 [Dehalococcoidia bacterium]|nr:hypothetical protein [Dehalococcoidia bacterium]
MKVSFRIIMIAVAVVGLGFGASFGAGVAYGRGTPKTVSAAPTQQQLNLQLGVTGSTGGASAAATQVAGAGGQRGGAAQALAGRTTTGRVTAIEGRTLTIETAQGSQKVNLAANATLEKLSTATLADFKVGDTIVASGTRASDGTFEASALSQVPQGLGGALGGLGGGGAQPAATPGGR